jgi:hypothetical protein
MNDYEDGRTRLPASTRLGIVNKHFSLWDEPSQKIYLPFKVDGKHNLGLEAATWKASYIT